MYAHSAALHPQHANIAFVSHSNALYALESDCTRRQLKPQHFGLNSQNNARGVNVAFVHQGVPGGLGEFDLASGCCLATAELRSTPTAMAYSGDGRLLVALMQVLGYIFKGLAASLGHLRDVPSIT